MIHQRAEAECGKWPHDDEAAQLAHRIADGLDRYQHSEAAHKSQKAACNALRWVCKSLNNSEKVTNNLRNNFTEWHHQLGPICEDEDAAFPNKP